MEKLSRNDPCWCGSGYKYKRCHLNRDRQEPLAVSEVGDQLRKLYNKSYCLAPPQLANECSGTIVKAHTVPKSGSLRKIERSGHVCSFWPHYEDLVKPDSELTAQLMGVNKASTFTGFCSFHDNDIFSAIDNQSFSDTQEQSFLLSYRALSRELFTKKYASSLVDLMQQTDRGRSLVEQRRMQSIISAYTEGIALGLRDLEYYKAEHDKILLAKDYTSIRSLIFKLEIPPPIMCSSTVYPEQDFNGIQFQELANPHRIPSAISFTSFHGGNCGIIVFTWLSICDAICIPFTGSLRDLPADRLTDGLIRFFFEYSENLHIKPDWWENLIIDKRDKLVNRLLYTMSVFNERKTDCLTDDGIKIDRWPITDIVALGY